MNNLLFKQPLHIDEVKDTFELSEVSVLTTPNLYPLVKGLEILPCSTSLQKKHFPIKNKMDGEK